MLNSYMRVSLISGDGRDGEGYVVLGGPAADACVTIVLFFVLAASVVIWEACAFAAMAALLLSAVWCLVVPVWTRRRRASTVVVSPASVGGLTGTAIDEALPASTYSELCGGGVTCSVCLEDVRGGETVRRLPECRHLFHVGCIDVWLHSSATCPLCRSDLSPRRRVVKAQVPLA